MPRLMPLPAARAALQCTAVDRSAEGLLRGTSNQRGILSLVTGARVGHAPAVDITADAVRVRILRQGPAIMARLFQDISAELANQFPGDPTLAPFANDVYALVESTLEGGARSRPWLRPPPAGDARLLPGKLSTALDVRAQRFPTVWTTTNLHQNERVATLPAGSLILADLGLAWFDDLTDVGHFVLSRLRARTSFVVVHELARQPRVIDRLIEVRWTAPSIAT